MKPFNLFVTLRSILLALLLAVGLSYAYAWTGPSGVAPTNNTPPPLNQGTDNQAKNAGLSLNQLGVFGNAAITGYLNAGTVQLSAVNVAGTACTPNGTISRETDGTALNCVSLVWKEFSTVAPPPPPPVTTSWNTPGTYSYVVPTGITSVKVTGTAGGGGGWKHGPNPGGDWFFSGSGGGGVVDQVVAVTSGETLTVVVGAGGPIMSGAGSPTYLKRGATNLVSLGGGNGGGMSSPVGGSGPLPGENGAYQSCNVYPKAKSGAYISPAVASLYGFGGFSDCDYTPRVGEGGYFQITTN